MNDLRQAAQAVVSAWKAGELGLGIKEFSALEAALAAQQAEPSQTIYCAEKRKPGGGQLHNLHCGWPKCNESPQQAAQPVAQEPRVCWLIEEFSDSGNSTGRYMQDQNDLTITTDAQKARQFLRSRTATFRATDMREKWGTAWRPVSHVFRAAQPQQATDKIGGAA